MYCRLRSCICEILRENMNLERVKNLIKELEYNNPVDTDRLSKDDTFMSIALAASKRSPDAQTKVGAVIVNPTGRIISTGYNGFPRDIDYSLLPNERPGKHDFMCHAEKNAVAWCDKRPKNCSIYITHESCNDCLFNSWQHGIIEVIEPINRITTNTDEKSKKVREIFLELTGMKIRKIRIDHLL